MKGIGNFYLLLIILLTLLLSSCTIADQLSPAPTATTETTAAVIPTATPAAATEPFLGLATVESLEILKQDTVPVQIEIRVTGVLANNCATVEDVVIQRDGSAFTAAVTSVQNPGPDCSDAAVPFEEMLPLNVEGLEAGSYTVTVNGIQGSFNLESDNLAEAEADGEAAPEATPEAAATAAPTASDAGTFTINGRVWHDLCSAIPGEDGEPQAGCIAAQGGAIVADGLFDDEPGIAGALVDLGRGACPAAETIVSATTDAEGLFTFGNVASGEYCIAVDSGSAQNQELLQPGSWSTALGEIAETTITLGDEETVQDINFGWDYELLPIDLTTCSNSFAFVEDLTVPDDTVFAPGETFTKSWRLRNNGTCPWTTDYAVQFVGGEQMGAEESIALSQTVAVAQALDVEVEMIAPDEPGTYRGNWQLADPNGEPFGIDGNIEDAFWLQIVVDEDSVPGATPLPNSGAIGGVVWDDFCINNEPGRGCVESGEGSGVFIADGTFDGLEVAMSEIVISLAEGACPGDGTLPQDAVLETSVTDEDGRYLFENLSDGTYCIFMDALSEENVDALIPGNWTWPATGVGRYSFILDPGEQALDLDFGWDHVE